jgi:hypothetical protein
MKFWSSTSISLNSHSIFCANFIKITRKYTMISISTSELQKICCELGDHQEVLNPWHNWLVLGSKSPHIFCFVLFGLIRLQETLKKIWGLEDQQEVLNLYIRWHNWLVLGSESPNIFCLVLFAIIRLQDTFEKKIEGLKISRKSSIYRFLGRSGSFWVQSLQTFFFCLIWDYKTSVD